MVKEELSSEEKFFEKAVVTEKFVKKYKNLMIGSVVAVVLFVAGNLAYNANKQNTIDNANVVLTELKTNPKDSAALAQLQTLSPTLADVWSYSNAIVNKDMKTLEKLQSSKAMFVGDLASYSVAQNADTTAKLDAYASKKDAIYADLANVQNAVILMNENKIDAAHQKLEMIGLNSPLSQVAKALMHYGVK
jgi:hypothetical protein